MSIEDVMLQAVKQGFNIDEKTVRHNVDYFKHNLNMCSCAMCECGKCQCKNPRFQLATSIRRRSVTPKVRDVPITVSRSFYETFESSYRQIGALPNQFITSNQRQYRGFSIKNQPSSYVANILPQTPFEGSTRYKEFFTDKQVLGCNNQHYYFKQPYYRHTGPLKGSQMETQNQRVFRRVKLENQRQPPPSAKLDSVLGVNLSLPMNSMYQTSFRESQESSQSVDRQASRQRRQEDLQCINQIMLPFQARSTSNSTYRQQTLFVCPAKKIQ